MILRDIAGDAAANAATRVKPSESELSQIDRPADDNIWHDAPVISKEIIRNQFKSQSRAQKPLSGQDVQEVAVDAAQAAYPTTSRGPEGTAEPGTRDQKEGTTSSTDASTGPQAGVQGLLQRANENIPDDTKDRAKNYHGRVMDYLGSKMPQDRRDRTIWRLKKMVVEVQGHKCVLIPLETLFMVTNQSLGITSKPSRLCSV